MSYSRNFLYSPQCGNCLYGSLVGFCEGLAMGFDHEFLTKELSLLYMSQKLIYGSNMNLTGGLMSHNAQNVIFL